MPDPTSMSVDLAGSVRQDVPRAHVPPGSLWTATDVRRTAGGWRKRFLYSDTDVTTSGLTGQAAMASPTHFIADFDGRHVNASNLRVTHRARDGAPWQDTGRVARFKPERADDIASGNLIPGSNGIVDTAATGRFVATTYAKQGVSNRIFFEVRDISAGAPGIVVYRFSAVAAISPRVIAIGDRFILAYISTGLNEVVVRNIDMYTLPHALSAATTVGTLATAGDRFDLAVHTLSNFVIAFRTATTTFSVWTRSAISLATVATRTFTCTNQVYDLVSVAGTSSNIWVVYNLNSAGTTLYGAVLNAALSATTTAETAITVVVDIIGTLSVIERSSSTVWLTVGGTASTCPKTHWGSLDTALAWTRNDFYAFAPTSRPVSIDTSNVHVWVTTRSTSSAITFAPHVLLRLTVPGATLRAERRVELVSDRKAFASGLSRVATTSGDSLANRQWIALPTYNYFGTDPTENVTLHSYTDVTGTTWPAAELEACAADRVLYASGGCVQEVTDTIPLGQGSVVLGGAENSFVIPPYIASATDVAGGSLTTGQQYQACVVWEHVDSQGRRTQSAPSNIVAQTLGGGDQTLRITVDPLSVTDRYFSGGLHGPGGTSESGEVLQAVVYVTGPGGSIFYRNETVSYETCAPEAASWTVDITSVSTSEEILYVQSLTSFGNYPAPACKRIWQGGGRVWVGGLFASREIECSRLLRPGEPASFTRAAQFRIQFPENVNDGAYLDGACVVLTDTSIFVVSGDGPQNDGSNPFGTPQRVVSDVGGTRFLVEVPAGLLFESPRGVFLLPRGFGAPQFIGARFQQSRGDTAIVGAMLNGFTLSGQNGERCVGLVLANGHVLVLDADTLEFISDDDTLAAAPLGCGTLDGKFVVAYNSGGVNYRLTTQNTSGYVASGTLTTGWIAPFGALGRGHIRRILTRAELRVSDVTGSLNSNISLVMTPDSTALYGNAATQDLNTGIAGELGDMIIVESNPPFQQCNALSLAWSITGNGASVRLTGFGLEGQGDPGGPKVGAALRTA